MSDLQEELRAILDGLLNWAHYAYERNVYTMSYDQAIASLTSLIDREKVRELRWAKGSMRHRIGTKAMQDRYMLGWNDNTDDQIERLEARIETLTPGGSDNNITNPGLRSEQ